MDVEEARLSDFQIKVPTALGDAVAVVSFRATCRLVNSEMILPKHVSEWLLVFVRPGGTWQVRDIRPLETKSMPFDSLDKLLR